MEDRPGKLVVISGPSGVGKTPLLRRLLADLPDLIPSVSATTRPPRAGERDGVAYHFMPVEEFENRSVLILGAGNAAAETADAVRNVARDIQVLGRFRRPKLMRDTHYVGDLRGRRTTHMDAFNLKSYEVSCMLS